jgi:peptide chain release factor 2
MLFDVDNANFEAENLEKESLNADFYKDAEKSKATLKKIKRLHEKIHKFEKLRAEHDDALELAKLASDEDDAALLPEIKKAAKTFFENLETARLETYLSGQYDKNNAILTFHSGAGGTEAQDWCEMLLRMYLRWAEKRGFSAQTLDILEGDEAGIKSASIQISGDNVYGFLKSEKGVHRLVRISPFDSSGRRHTSFASVEVMPEIENEAEVEISPDDLKVDTFRSSGAGGQHVNKTESAIRITHVPTGVVVACQAERSQHKNRDTAMKMLRAKLAEIAERQHKSKIEDIKGAVMDNGWGSQIRSYVFNPYSLVKDHRTNFEVGSVQSVMDGAIDGFISAFLIARSRGELT